MQFITCFTQKLYFSFSDVHFGELQPLFYVDPYLLRYFVLKTDINYLSSLFEKVPMSILLMRLTKDCSFLIKVSNMYMWMCDLCPYRA